MKKLLVVIFLISLLSCQGNEISISEVNQPGKPESIEQLFDDYFKKPVDLRLLVEAAKESFNKLERWTGTKK